MLRSVIPQTVHNPPTLSSQLVGMKGCHKPSTSSSIMLGLHFLSHHLYVSFVPFDKFGGVHLWLHNKLWCALLFMQNKQLVCEM